MNKKIYKCVWDYSIPKDQNHLTRSNWNDGLNKIINTLSVKMWRDLGEQPNRITIPPELSEIFRDFIGFHISNGMFDDDDGRIGTLSNQYSIYVDINLNPDLIEIDFNNDDKIYPFKHKGIIEVINYDFNKENKIEIITDEN